VKSIAAGKKGVLGFLVGQVMKETKGSANPKLVSEMLEKLTQAS
jgi:aspartyl-tRNA(Asn)/glutamyl-tRNA(Gln) amidotransferase subunit B